MSYTKHLEQIADIAAKMRAAQKEYYSSKRLDVLDQSKKLERQLDKLLKDLPDERAPRLFE